MRVAVFGGTGLIGSQVCRALIACGCAVTSISRNGDICTGTGKRMQETFIGESWVNKVNFVQADANIEDAVLQALADGVDGVVSCMGSSTDLLSANSNGWNGRCYWSESSRQQYAQEHDPVVKVVTASKSAGAQRFVYVGVSSDAERGFGGPLPGLYTGKRAAALAARDAFGLGNFVYVGPHLVVGGSDDVRIKALNSGLGRGLMAINDAIGEIRSFGEDYTTKTRLTPPVTASAVASVIAASVTGSVDVAESVRRSGMTVDDGAKDGEATEIADPMRLVDGTDAILALAKSIRR